MAPFDRAPLQTPGTLHSVSSPLPVDAPRELDFRITSRAFGKKSKWSRDCCHAFVLLLREVRATLLSLAIAAGHAGAEMPRCRDAENLCIFLSISVTNPCMIYLSLSLF